MLYRWNTITENINLALIKLKDLISRNLPFCRNKRGRKPKQKAEDYISLLVLKEFDEASLRKAEVRLSKFIIGERVDHSVIAYWERKPEVTKFISEIIKIAGAILSELVAPLFAFVDATKFTSWHINEFEVTVCNRIAVGTVYPVGISFQTKTVRDPVNEAVPKGSRLLYADAWYDDNKAIGVLFDKGYIPVICPNKNRWRGAYRKRARKIYNQPVHRRGYKQRGRGESLFGSLTNKYGDRFNARNDEVMKTRIASRILSYQLRLFLIVIKKIYELLDTLRITFYHAFSS